MIGRCVPRAAVGRDERGTTREMTSSDRRTSSNGEAYSKMVPSHLGLAIDPDAVRSLTALATPLAWHKELWRDSDRSPALIRARERGANSIQKERKTVGRLRVFFRV